MQALYSGEILGILTLVVTKGSMLFALRAITPYVAHRMVIYGTSFVTVAWGTSAVFAVAFQCPSPRRWDVVDHKCINIVCTGHLYARLTFQTNSYAAGCENIH